MPLDFSILDDSKHAVATVPVGLDQHWRFFGQLSPDHYPLLSQLSDYYSDARFEFGELGGLLIEIARRESESSTADNELLREVSDLVSDAMKAGRAVDVIAD